MFNKYRYGKNSYEIVTQALENALKYLSAEDVYQYTECEDKDCCTFAVKSMLNPHYHPAMRDIIEDMYYKDDYNYPLAVITDCFVEATIKLMFADFYYETDTVRDITPLHEVLNYYKNHTPRENLCIINNISLGYDNMNT